MLLTIALAAAPLIMGGPSHTLTCESTEFYVGGELKNGDHVNMDIVQNGKKFQVNAYVDLNVPDGYKTLGLRFSNGDTFPLNEEEVKSGVIDFPYSSLLDDTDYTVEWVQYNSSYFNQDRNPDKFLDCIIEDPEEPETPEEPEEPETPEKPEKPKDKVTVEVIETRNDPVCIEGVTVQSVFFREETTTVFWVFDEDKWKWVEGGSNVEVTNEWSDEETIGECELPDTGMGSLLGIGAAVALIGGGIIARRVTA